jgi:very-short-patch-repair endonuclease
VVRRVASLPRTDIRIVDGIPVTSPGRTIIDLAAVLPLHRLEIVLDDAIRRRLVKVGDLRRRRPVWGASALNTLLDQRARGDSVPGSALETAFLRLLRRAGLPEPTRQWPVKRAGRTVAVVDFAYPQALLVIEIDGYRYHSGRRDWQRDLTRQNEIVACGLDVLRFTSEDVLERSEETCARVAIALARVNG